MHDRVLIKRIREGKEIVISEKQYSFRKRCSRMGQVAGNI